MIVEEQPRTSVTKATLLEEAIDFSARHGLSGVSLRQMAEAIGTSHRMLIYHFGSKEGLMVAIVEEVEERQREFFATLAQDDDLTPVEASKVFWRRLSDPALEPNIRLFFELYIQAMQRRPGTGAFLDNIVDAWV